METPEEEEGEVEEYVDDQGRTVRRIVKRTLTTTRRVIIQSGEPMETSTIEIPDIPEDAEVEEFVDEEGRTVRKIIRRNVTTKTILLKADGDKKEPIVFESGEPVYLEEEPTQQVLDSEGNVVVSTLQVSEGLPHIDERVEEFVDDEGRKVRRVVKHYVTRKTIVHEGQMKPVEHVVSFPGTITEGDDVPKFETASPVSSPEGYVDSSGRTWVTTSSDISPTMKLETVFTPHDMQQPVSIEEIEEGVQPQEEEHVEEYVDDDGRRVRRIVKRYVTTKTIVQERMSPYVTFPDGEVTVNVTEEEPFGRHVHVVSKESVEHVAIAPRDISVSFETPSELKPELEEVVEESWHDAVLFKEPVMSSSIRTTTSYTLVDQRFVTIMYSLYQLVIEMKSLLVIYTAKYNIKFNFELESFLLWIIEMETELANLRPVTWKLEGIRHQQLATKVLEKTVRAPKTVSHFYALIRTLVGFPRNGTWF
jgi:hypothetical protein